MSSKHFISLDQAKKMTKRFREDKRAVIRDEYHGKHIMPRCETFERAAFDKLLATPGCAAIRAYYGMDVVRRVHVIFVAVDSNNKDILPPDVSADQKMAAATLESDIQVLENGDRCPDLCPESSPLTS